MTIAVPSGGKPYLLDMSTSVVARGKIVNALERNEEIPIGWAVDKAGNPTTDPASALEGALLPAGGPKGLRACYHDRSVDRSSIRRVCW